LKSIVAVALVPSRNDEVKDLNGKQIKLLELVPICDLKAHTMTVDTCILYCMALSMS
jgi:hypothetical protein